MRDDASFGAFTAAVFQVEVFWVVTPCSVVVGYQRFGGTCCLRLQGDKTVWRQDAEDLNFMRDVISHLRALQNKTFLDIPVSLRFMAVESR
jgi:hypothetical protein